MINNRIRTIAIVSAATGALLIGLPGTAQAKKVAAQVISTQQITTNQPYHGRHGKLYADTNLTKTVTHLRKHPHTTWYVSQQARIQRRTGKQDTYYYVTSGNKNRMGWVKTKDLKPGKVTSYQAFRLRAKADISSMIQIVRTTSPKTQDYILPTFTSIPAKHAYSNGDGDDLSEVSYLLSDEVNRKKHSTADKQQDTQAVIQMYNLFKGRLGNSMNKKVAAEYDRLMEAQGKRQKYFKAASNLADGLSDGIVKLQHK